MYVLKKEIFIYSFRNTNEKIALLVDDLLDVVDSIS